MASRHDEVTTMPNLTLRQWEHIKIALLERYMRLSNEAREAEQPRKKEMLKKMSDDCMEIRAIIRPVIDELEEQIFWG